MMISISTPRRPTPINTRCTPTATPYFTPTSEIGIGITAVSTIRNARVFRSINGYGLNLCGNKRNRNKKKTKKKQAN